MWREDGEREEEDEDEDEEVEEESNDDDGSLSFLPATLLVFVTGMMAAGSLVFAVGIGEFVSFCPGPAVGLAITTVLLGANAAIVVAASIGARAGFSWRRCVRDAVVSPA